MSEETLEHEEWVCKRLADWLDDENRRPANMEFTAGAMRDLARKIEYKLNR